MKPTPRHEKMYAHSPVLAEDENGKKYIKKATPEEMATTPQDSPSEHEDIFKELAHKQAVERMAVYHKHETESLELMKKYGIREPQGE